jgi:hypothetical protein
METEDQRLKELSRHVSEAKDLESILAATKELRDYIAEKSKQRSIDGQA